MTAASSVTIKSRPLAGGRVSWFLYFRPALPDGTSLLPVEGYSRPEDRASVEAFAAPYRASLRKVKHGPRPEDCDRYFERYIAYSKECGSTDADKKATRWNKWIAPKIGDKRPEDVTRSDVEDIRDALDAAILAWEPGKAAKNGTCLSGKTAMNVWTALTSTFKEATASKRRDLRVLDGKPNPCVGVKPPGDRRTRKARRKTFLYPREAAALLACTAVPVEWREVYALALYTYVRPGELRALTFGDIDREAKLIHVSRAWDYQANEVKMLPKSDAGVRTVPIEPALAPLLERMAEGKQPSAHVVPTLSDFGEDHLAQLFRKHLQAAKVERAALHASTHSHVQSNFRSCRDSGITWLALRGLSVDKIKRRAGHGKIDISDGYVKLAEDHGDVLGEPFGPLPASLTEPAARLLTGCEPPVNCELPDSPTIQNHSRILDGSVPEEGVESSSNTYIYGTSSTSCEPVQHAPTVGNESLRASCTRLAIKARLLERLLIGRDENVLASELRAELEALAGPLATVIPMRRR